MRSRFLVLFLILVVTLLASCGPGSSAQEVDVQGLWTGDLQSYQLFTDAPVYAAIQRDGYGLAVVGGTPSHDAPDDGTFFILPPIGTSDIGGDLTVISQSRNSDASTSSTYGTASPAMISLTFNENPADPRREMDCMGECGTLTLKNYTPFTGMPSLLSGPWQGYSLHALVGDQPAVDITVASDGTFSGTDSHGCKFTGSISQLTAGKNLFSVTADYCSDPIAYKGLGFESSTDISGKFAHAKGVYFYIGISQPVKDTPQSNALFSEFKLP